MHYEYLYTLPNIHVFSYLDKCLSNIELDISHIVLTQLEDHRQHGGLDDIRCAHLHQQVHSKQSGHPVEVVGILRHVEHLRENGHLREAEMINFLPTDRCGLPLPNQSQTSLPDF